MCIFDAALLEEAMKVCGDDANAVFDYIAENCTQYCADAGTYYYGDAKAIFESEPFAVGMDEETLDEIRKVLKV